jgi:hypothetical protein
MKRRLETTPSDSNDAILPANTTVSLETASDEVLVYLIMDLYDGDERIVRRNIRTPQTIKIRDIYGFRGRVKPDGFLYADSCNMILNNGEAFPVRGSFEVWIKRHERLKEKMNKRNPIGFKINAGRSGKV